MKPSSLDGSFPTLRSDVWAYPLLLLGQKIKAHWKYRPKMYAELEKSGQLQRSLHAAQERTNDLMYELQNGPRKLDYHEAWELAREEWAFLATEDDVPELGFDIQPRW